MKNMIFSTIAAAALLVFSGCSSHEVSIAPVQPQKYEVLGKAEGNGNGSLGLLGTAYYFIPMGLNSRTESAYNSALQSVPNSTGLVNVTYKEDWFWWIIGTNRSVTITGDAIREVK